MVSKGITPSDKLISKLIGVHSEAVHVQDTLNLIEKMKEKFNFKPTELTYNYLITMHIKNKDIDSAIKLKEEMMLQNLTPNSDTYGILIDNLTRREMIVEALKLVEESAHNNIKILEKHMKILRGRCANLHVTHPDIPEDPNKWVKQLKETRRKNKNVSNGKVESIKSAMFS